MDAFEMTRFRGRRRRLFGPTLFKSVRSRAEGSGATIDSLIAGPAAYARLYQASEPDGTSVWLLPGESVADVVELRIGDDIDSIQLLDRPCEKGEPGYAAFLVAKQKAESRQDKK